MGPVAPRAKAANRFGQLDAANLGRVSGDPWLRSWTSHKALLTAAWEPMTALREQVNSLRWFHEIDFGDGIRSPGGIKISKLARVADLVFDRPLANKTVLDIGCWDGAQSLEAVRRGASRVVATDHFVWQSGVGDRRCIELVREHLAPSMEIMDIDVPDLTPERVGTFDIVLFLGVLYHLKDPFTALERVARLAKELLVLESRILRLPLPWPYARFWPGATLERDPTNWWTFTAGCVVAMLRDIGFRKVTTRRPDWRFKRCIFHAEW
jgi:tRNA (mo5U34)-methyltransferase